MPEPLGHHRQVHALGDHQGRGAVPKVVQPHHPHAGRQAELTEALRHARRVHRGAVLPGEDQAVILVRLAPARPLLILREPVRQQRAHQLRAERHAPVLAGRRLRLAELELVPDGHELLAHVQHAAVEVHVRPSQPQGLAAAQPGEGHELQQRTEPVAGHVVQEPS
nr:hypothetical protein [Micromonospora sp. Mcm103]